MHSGYRELDPCVHCGFCLPACPTYLATGDENDSPRGRIVLMRALERGEIDPADPALTEHLGACLGCRGCEPACPSGVGYGRGLEQARRDLVAANGMTPALRGLLAVFASPALWRPGLTLARWLRATGLPDRWAGPSRMGFAFGMLAATRAPTPPSGPASARSASRPARRPDRRRGTVALFRGCVMDTLFSHVHHATQRTLAANGYEVIDVDGQVCCGALHDHAGDAQTATRLARQNMLAFAAGAGAGADYVVVNSAGCGASLKDHPHLLGVEAGGSFASRIRDVSELLAMAGPRPGGPLPIDVAYDAPCHLHHAQRVGNEPVDVLAAVPELRLRTLPGAERCCGSAGLYALVRPAMARAVLENKIADIAGLAPAPELVVSGNPGCIMHIGAGIKAAGLGIGVAHPVEVLDWSYDRAGYY